MITNIQKLLKLSIRTNNNRLKITLRLPDFNTNLICKIKIIKKVLNMNDIQWSVHCKRFITQKLKYLKEKEKYIINNQFNNRLKNTICS